MDEITALFRRIIAEPIERCKGHKPVVEITNGRPFWRCLLCNQMWPMTTGKREEARGELS